MVYSWLSQSESNTKYVEGAVYIDRVGGDGVVDGSRDGTQGGLVTDAVDAGAGAVYGVVIADVAFNEFEAGVLFELCEVAAAAGGEVVEHADEGHAGIVEQGCGDVGYDESGTAGEEYVHL